MVQSFIVNVDHHGAVITLLSMLVTMVQSFLINVGQDGAVIY